jgi:hypothetical protein
MEGSQNLKFTGSRRSSGQIKQKHRHIIVKQVKFKQKKIKSAREKSYITFREAVIEI